MKLVHIDSVSDTQTFTVESGALRVTDPCYDMDTWCAGTLDTVRNGIWNTHVGYHKDADDMAYYERAAKERRAEIDRHEKLLMDKCGTNAEVAEMIRQDFTMFRADLDKREAEANARPGRVAFIHIAHAESAARFDPKTPLDSNFVLADIDVGVDSGQAGFFDLAKYALSLADKDDSRSRRESKDSVFEAFYDSVCNLTLDDKSFGTLQFGTVSSSGYGDGSYNCYARRDDFGTVVEAVIIFLEEYEDADETDEEGELAG